MRSIIAALRSLVLPFGTTSGTRIVIDGVLGRISFFDATDAEVIRQDSAASAITAGNLTGARVVMDGANARISSYNSTPTETVRMDASSSSVVAGSQSTGARAVLDGANTRLSLFNSWNAEKIRADASAQTLTVGSQSSGDRAVLDGSDGTLSVINSSGLSIKADPATAGFPTLYFFRGSNYAWVNSPAAGEIEVSAEKSGSPRTLLRVAPSSGVLAYLDGSDVLQGGYVQAGSSDATIGKVAGGTYQSYIVVGSSFIEIEAGVTIKSVSTYNFTTASGANVHINSYGNFFRSTSARKYKVNIQDADISPADVLTLTPKTFHDKRQWDEWHAKPTPPKRHARPTPPEKPARPTPAEKAPHRLVGLIAEDVAAVPGLAELLVEYDENGNPDSVNYDRLGVALLAVCKNLEHRISALEAKVP